MTQTDIFFTDLFGDMSLKSINGVTQDVTDMYQTDGQLFDPRPLQSIFRVSLGRILNPNLQNDMYCNVIQY